MIHRPETAPGTNEDFIVRNLERLVRQGNLTTSEYKIIWSEMHTLGISPERRMMLQKLFGEDKLRQRAKFEVLGKEGAFIEAELKTVNEDPALQGRVWAEVQDATKLQIADLTQAQESLASIGQFFEKVDRDGDKADENLQRQGQDATQIRSLYEKLQKPSNN
jgi:hypothetical protein